MKKVGVGERRPERLGKTPESLEIKDFPWPNMSAEQEEGRER